MKVMTLVKKAAIGTAFFGLLWSCTANVRPIDMEKVNLQNFDDLDFRLYSGQKWDELQRSHDNDIIVH